MQIITMYLRADSVNAKPVDAYNQQLNVLPALTRGMRAKLALVLLDSEGNPLDHEELSKYVSWDFVIADDWNSNTPPQIRVSEGITVKDNIIVIPLAQTNTDTLIEALGNQASVTFGCEIAGFEAGETSPAFLLQFDIAIRNRRGDAGTGTPEPVNDGNYSAAQVNALLRARLEVEFSQDGKTWIKTTGLNNPPSEARFYRFRNVAIGGIWSDPLPLVAGPRGVPGPIGLTGEKGDSGTLQIDQVLTGAPGTSAKVVNKGTLTDSILDITIPEGIPGQMGKSSYIYIAYASGKDGQGFSLLPGPGLKYRAEILSHNEFDPTERDFIGATWVKYIGDDGISLQPIEVSDRTVTVGNISRLIFENAEVSEGPAGAVIINFPVPDTPNRILCNYSTFNGVLHTSPWTGAGRSCGSVGNIESLPVPGPVPSLVPVPNYSIFKGDL